MKAKYLILFLISILVFSLGLGCSKAETDIEEKYISKTKIILLAIADNKEQLNEAFDAYINGKISSSVFDKRAEIYVEKVKIYYDKYLEIKPPKKFEKAHEIFGKGMKHLSKSVIFFQNFIDTNDEKYVPLFEAEEDLAMGYLSEAVELMDKLTE